MSWLASHLAPLMLLVLIPLLFCGIPVAFSLAACGLLFGVIGMQLGLLPWHLLGALPLRVYGILANENLLAIPFFTFMGLILQKSGMAEDLLETVGQVFGPVRGGLALTVIFVGALMAATTGVVAASVISMGLISLPVMLRHGYQPAFASGVISASGSLTQIVPPSLVLIVMGDQLGVSLGDMYAGALVPAALLIGGYALLVIIVALLRPGWVPAVPREANAVPARGASSGHRSLGVLMLISVFIGGVLLEGYPALLRASGRDFAPPTDELAMAGVAATVLAAFVLALADSLTRLHWLSALARRVAFVLIPPLILIFLVLGSIVFGVATPTEGGAMGASGALALAAARGRFSRQGLAQALLSASKIACVVMLLMVGSTIFSLSFNLLEGGASIERLFALLPGGPTGFLLFATALIFVLGMFLDFFEIAVVLVPLLTPIAHKLGIDLIWFGVLIGVNLQTSFLTPPFGFALFFLRGVAPQEDRTDPRTGRLIRGLSTRDIYVGVQPFVLVQVLVMGLMIAFPSIVLSSLDRSAPKVPAARIEQLMREMSGPSRAQDRADPAALLIESMKRP
jgi:TRAP-type mannitol/chloroaromatic compound transport system permease large subunit